VNFSAWKCVLCSLRRITIFNHIFTCSKNLLSIPSPTPSLSFISHNPKHPIKAPRSHSNHFPSFISFINTKQTTLLTHPIHPPTPTQTPKPALSCQEYIHPAFALICVKLLFCQETKVGLGEYLYRLMDVWEGNLLFPIQGKKQRVGFRGCVGRFWDEQGLSIGECTRTSGTF
jgi:hypothetical protein